MSSMPALTSLNIRSCCKLTDEALRAVSNMPQLTFLDISNCHKLTDEGLRVLSSMPKLTSLNLTGCNATAAGVQALRSSTAAPNLQIVHTEREDSSFGFAGLLAYTGL